MRVDALERMHDRPVAETSKAAIHHHATTVGAADAGSIGRTIADIVLDLVAPRHDEFNVAWLVVDHMLFHNPIMGNRTDIAAAYNRRAGESQWI